MKWLIMTMTQLNTIPALEETYFDWRCIVCCMVALSPQNLENQHLPGTESVYFDLDNTPWVKCDKCHTPFHLQCGTWESLQVVRNKHFLLHFFAADSLRPFILCVLVDLPPPFYVCSFRLCCVSLALLCCVSFALKMARKKLPWNSQKEKEVTRSWWLPSSNTNRCSSTEPAMRPCGASDTEYIGNRQSPPQPKAQSMGC